MLFRSKLFSAVWCLLVSFAFAEENTLLGLPDTNVVNIDSGPVVGKVNSHRGVKTYMGIPFADKPIGDLRFRPPQSPPSWTEPLEAYLPGPICPQARVIGELVIGKEDCLYLDVYTPENAKEGDKLPVMLWIYGGGYDIGDGVEFGLYDGRNLANKHNVVVVAFNYRLAVFGFLAHEQLMKEDKQHSTGNYAMLDQRFAMEWVQRNIEKFGGDKNRVTIFGESAGAFSVCWHVASPGSKGLFHAAIMESGTCDAQQFFQPLKPALEFGDFYAKSMGCDSSKPDFLECLRGLSTADIMDSLVSWLSPDWPNLVKEINKFEKSVSGAVESSIPAFAPFMPWGPTIDGAKHTLDVFPLENIQKGKHNKVPMILGTNKDEGVIFTIAIPLVVRDWVTFPLTEKSYSKAVNFFWNNATAVDAINQVYTKKAYKSPTDRIAVLLRDYFFTCPNRRAARAFSAHADTYLYQYVYKIHWIDGILGDYHMSELWFVWDNQWPPIVHAYNENDKKMAATFGTYWTNFAKNANPNSDGWTEWPKFTPEDDSNMVLDVPAWVNQHLYEDICDFWDAMPPAQSFVDHHPEIYGNDYVRSMEA